MKRRKKKDEPYFIEVDTVACRSCGRGKTWRVIGPDGVGESTSYEDEEDAIYEADKLNDAYANGAASKKEETKR